jgi:hypothetical protein
MPKDRALDAAKYCGKPKIISKHLNAALETGDVTLITKAIGVWCEPRAYQDFRGRRV